MLTVKSKPNKDPADEVERYDDGMHTQRHLKEDVHKNIHYCQ